MTKRQYTIRISTAIAIAILCLATLVGLLSLSASAGGDASDIGGDKATQDILSILDLHADDTLIGETVVVTGCYVAWGQKYLALDCKDFEANHPVPPHGYVRLEGQAPGPEYNGCTLIVTGTLGLYYHDYPWLGEEEGRRIIVSDTQPLSAPPLAPTSLASVAARSTSPSDLDQVTAPQAVDCKCKWAFIVSGGINKDNNHPRYWNDVVQKWDYKVNHARYPTKCVTVFYYTGTAKTADVPAARVMSATQANIEAQMRALAPAMQACKEKGIKPTLQFLVTDHGSGYHSTDQEEPAVRQGLAGWPTVDVDGDEGDSTSESNLRVDARELAPNNMGKMDLFPDDGQSPDTIVENSGGIVGVWRCITPPCTSFPTDWVLVGVDMNGDDIIDATDGGIDLNGDGDTDDLYGFDEAINLLDDEAITDDELTNMLRPLCSSGVDLYVEMAQCFGGGFQRDLDRLRAAGCHVHFAAAAGEGEYSWGDDDKDYFEHAFISKMINIITTTGSVTITPDIWKQAYDHAASQPDSTAHNTHPVSDIDCLVMIGPYIKDGQVCIKVINYCGQEVVANLRLAAYNFGISTDAVDDHTGTVTLAAGKSREWCWPLPVEPGTYCFFGRASMSEPKQEYHPRWLNDQIVVTARPANAEPVEQNFIVGGEDVAYPLVWLEPYAWLPDGWGYELSDETVWVGDGPVWVTMTIYPTSTTPGVGGLWVYGWGMEEGPETPRDSLQSMGGGPMPTYEYLGYVYLEVDTRYRVYLPLVVREY